MSAPLALIAPGAGLLDAPGGSGAFSNVLHAQLAELDRSLKTAQTQSMRLAAGEAESLHQLMLKIEQARIGFQLALQVRNRLMESWQDVQRMQL